MSIEFNCPACAKPYRVKDELAGKTARCVCGQQIKIPEPPQPTADLTDLLDEIDEPTKQPTSAPVNPQPTTRKATRLPGRYGILAPFGKWLENTQSALVKIAIGAIVGAIVAAMALARDNGNLAKDTSTWTICALGGSAMGALAASILVVVDAKRNR